MADTPFEDDLAGNAADAEGEPESYNQKRMTRLERFRQLGGGKPIHEDVIAIGAMPTLAVEITPKHRELVMELAATGMSQETAARILGISKERLQTLFDKEWDVGFDLASGDMQRTIRLNGKMGDSWSAVQWLRYHPRSKFSDKTERTDKGAEQDKDINAEAVKAANDALVAALISGIATDPKLKRPAEQKRQAATVAPAKVAAKKLPAVVKKPKGD